MKVRARRGLGMGETELIAGGSGSKETTSGWWGKATALFLQVISGLWNIKQYEVKVMVLYAAVRDR